MLSLRDFLSMSSSLRLVTIATIASLVIAQPTGEVLQQRQTSTTCNPTESSNCPADTALGTSVKIDFISGASSDFTASGNPTYDSNGASFTVAKSGDAPTLTSNWYIMFGTYSITMKAAPGAGIVSSSVLLSDDLDEIDWEWLGAQDDQVQSNYFGKGQTTTYDRAAVQAVSDSQGDWHTYTIDWTEEQIVWSIDGTTVRVLTASAANGMFPQTPMQLKIGSWSGGDPSNPEGTIQWAQGPTDYSDGPFTMIVQSVSVTDYSTGKSYEYGNESGDWSSIESNGGSVNANAASSGTTDTAAPAITSTAGGTEPYSGTHASCTTCTTPGLGTYTVTSTNTCTGAASATSYLNLPSGYSVDACTGKVVTPSAALSTSLYVQSSSSPAPLPAGYCSALGYSVVTSYDIQGFLTTATVPIGISTGWNDQGFLTTVYPSDCQTPDSTSAAGTIFQPGTVVAAAASAKGMTGSDLMQLPTVSADRSMTAVANVASFECKRTEMGWMTGMCITTLTAITAGFIT